MPNNTIRVAKTIEAFNYDSDNRPTSLMSDQIADTSVANAKLVHDSITINGTEVDLGGSITISGGVTPPSNQSRITITLTPSGLTQATGANQTISVQPTFTGNGYTIISSQVTVHDQTNRLILTRNNLDSFSFTADRSTAGQYTVTASAVVSHSGQTFTDTRTAHLTIAPAWYMVRSSTAPADLNGFGGPQGAFSAPQTFAAPNGTDTLYIAVPSRSGGYSVLDGDLRIIVPSQGTNFATGYTLYSTDEAVAGTTYVITEA